MFSILSAIYKNEKPSFLRQYFDSIFDQTLLPNEIILVKDGPLTDELNVLINKYVARYPIIKIIELKVNKGLGLALNEGLKHCTNELVARLDTDDISIPTRFEKQVQVLNRNSQLDLVGSLSNEFTVDKNGHLILLSTKFFCEKHEQIVKYSKKRNPLEHSSVMFRKTAVIEAGGYKHYPLFEDYYLWVRMLVNGSRFYNVQEKLVLFRHSSDMIKRRGGWKYAIKEVQLLHEFQKIGFLNRYEFLQNVLLRFPVRMMPNDWRILIYNKYLRKEVSYDSSNNPNLSIS